jgi:hypothetical protein
VFIYFLVNQYILSKYILLLHSKTESRIAIITTEINLFQNPELCTKHVKIQISRLVKLVDKCRQDVCLHICHQFFQRLATLLFQHEQTARAEKEKVLLLKL